MADGPHEVLASLLDELGWSPRALARRINHVFGAGTVADTAPYHWRDSGCTPRPPLPELAAWVLSRELGRPVTAAELWQGRASGSPLVLPADIDMNGPWSRVSTWACSRIGSWPGFWTADTFSPSPARRSSTSSPDIQTGDPGRLAAALERGSVGHLLLAQIEQSIPLLQRLNHTHGGGVHLPYVGAQFRSVALLLRQGGHPAWWSVDCSQPSLRSVRDLEQACTIGSLAVTRLERVQSVKSAQILRLTTTLPGPGERGDHKSE